MVDMQFEFVLLLFTTVVTPVLIIIILLNLYYNKYINKNYLCRKCHSSGVDTYITKDEHDAYDGNCKTH